MAGQVITIGRQCGSGGHTIGEQVAKILGVPFYDRELIEMTAQESGFGKEFVEEQGEHRNSSMLYNLVKNLSYSRSMPSGNSEYLQDEIFFVQRKIITELAEKEPCVIVGRCADSILKETGNSLNIYIHAEKAFKAKHLMETMCLMMRLSEKWNGWINAGLPIINIIRTRYGALRRITICAWTAA